MSGRRLTLVFLLYCVLTVLSLAFEADRADTGIGNSEHDVTTMAADTTTFNDTDCLCDCEELETGNSSTAPSTQEEAEKAASELATELRVDRSNLSSTTRRKTSAPDHRPSAQGMGIVGVLVIVFVLGSVVVLDFTVLLNDIKFAFTRLFGYPQGQPPHRCRIPHRVRRGLRRNTTSRSFYGSSSAGSGAGAGGAPRRLDGSTGTSSLATNGNCEGVPPDLRSRREMLIMHGIRHH